MILVRNDTVSISPSIDSDNRAHNHCFRITQTQKVGVLQVVNPDEDVCNRNGKPSNPLSLIPSTYCHYFHTILIPSEEIAFLMWLLIYLLDLKVQLGQVLELQIQTIFLLER